MLVLGRLMARQDDGANGWPPVDDKNVVACGVDEAVATMFDGFVFAEASDDVEFDIFDAGPEAIGLPASGGSLAFVD